MPKPTTIAEMGIELSTYCQTNIDALRRMIDDKRRMHQEFYVDQLSGQINAYVDIKLRIMEFIRNH